MLLTKKQRQTIGKSKAGRRLLARRYDVSVGYIDTTRRRYNESRIK